MLKYLYNNTLLYSESPTKHRFILRITEVFFYKSKDNLGVPEAFSSWKDVDGTVYGYYVRGVRMDFTDTPTVLAFVPNSVGNGVERVQVGDYVWASVPVEGGNPVVQSVVYSKSTTWDEAVKNFERPVPPMLELEGAQGKIYTYNPVYMTFIPTYRPTDPDFGAWYDRFVKFNDADTYKNFKSLGSYNKWVGEMLSQPQQNAEEAKMLLKIVEDPFDPNNYLEKSFYLSEGKFPYRPDSAFDTISEDHQSQKTDRVLRSKGGTSLLGSFSEQNLDLYPKPLPLQDSLDPKLARTSYDEVINEALAELRRSAQSNLEGFKPEIANADLPLDPKISREIRIGRNKLLLSDVHGDGSLVFLTLKTSGDQNLSMIFKENDTEQWSQVRLRGFLGESLLLESRKSSSNDGFSRFLVRGIEGQLVEMYDDAQTQQNYLYVLSSERNELKNFSLDKASFALFSNGTLPSAFARLQNNPLLGEVSGRSALVGVYEGQSRSLVHLSASSSESRGKIWMGQGGSSEALFENVVTSGNSVGQHLYRSGGSFANTSYDAAARVYKTENSDNAKIEINGLNITINGPENVQVNSKNAKVVADTSVTVVSPEIKLGSDSSSTKMAKVGTKISATLKYADLQQICGNCSFKTSAEDQTIISGNIVDDGAASKVKTD